MLKKVVAAVAALVCVWAVSAQPASAATLPHGFVDEFVASVPAIPTGMAQLPDGQILFAQKNGSVRRIDAQGNLQSQVVISVASRMCNDWERGLLGIAVDPNFAVNRYFYIYWTQKRSGGCGNPAFNGPVNRVTRHVLLSTGQASPSSEYVVLDGIPNRLGIHNAGDLNFGKDGMLYVTTGDGGCHHSNGSQCADANTASREGHTLIGKVLRVTRDGHVPGGNPYAGGARCRLGNASPGQVCAETFLRGFRNPYRFAFDPNAAGTRFFVNDVGSHTWEEINEAVAGSDYGWNLREGPCATGSDTNCGPTGFRNPIHSLHHGNTGCASITGGAFVPADLWPAPYSRSYLFADFVCEKIFRLVPQGTGYTATEFATGVGPVTNLDFAKTPDGGDALYYFSFAQSGEIRRIRFVGDVNRPPTAALEVRTEGTSLTATFDASGSTEPDGDPMTYRLDPGDGSPVIQSTSPVMTHTYATGGRKSATLTVLDDEGLASVPVTREFAVGDRPPEVELASPAATHRFSVGETLDVQVRATDAEDGPLPSSSVEITVERAHDTHRHPYVEPTTGDRLAVTAPAPEDIHSTRNSHLVVTATARDSAGQTTTREFNVMPHTVLFILKANLPITYTVNGQQIKQDTHLYSWAGWPISVVAPERYDMFKRFIRWEDNRSTNRFRTIVTPPFDATYRTYYAMF